MKTIIATVGAVMTAVTLGAQEADEKTAEVEEEEEESAVFEAGVDVDFFSAYVWRNSVQNDDMVIQPCVWADYTQLEPFWFGFSVWQNYDLTDSRYDALSHGLTETDFNVHVGATAWANEDETMSLEFEFGHEWYDNHFVKKESAGDLADTRELYLKGRFANPVADVYGQVSWMYRDFGCFEQGVHYELGFAKEVELVEDALTLGADWNLNFGDSHYLYFLYAGLSNPYVEIEDGEEVEYDDFDRGPDGGIGATTLKVYLSWAVTDWLSVKGTLAYTGLLNGELRQAHGDYGDENRDIVWGGISLNCAF